MKREITSEIKSEIAELCYKAVRGQSVNIRRLDELYRNYPKEFSEISDKTNEEARREMAEFSNHLAKLSKVKETGL